MKERPILFTGAMVRALLDGSKTQTRRAMKPQPQMVTDKRTAPWDGDPAVLVQLMLQSGKPCPYGQPGDQLWVREAWRTDKAYDNCAPGQMDSGASLFMLADQHAHRINHRSECGPMEWGKTRVSIHMPRWASRITLEIVSVHVERLNKISEADCIAEGCAGGHGSIPGYGYAATPLEHYGWLWDFLNKKGRPTLPTNPASKRYADVKHWLETHPDTTSWAANPWVWVVEFKRNLA